MKRAVHIVCAVVIVAALGSAAPADTDTFGTGGNQFTIDFVTISGDASSANGTNISQFSPGVAGYRTFTDPGDDYRIGVLEITNAQWDKFKASLSVPVTGAPSNAYDELPHHTGANEPTDNASWYEAAQFVNWLNTSTGHQAAYNFTGTQGTGNYTLGVWETGDAGYDSSNPYRNSNAYYVLPTEDEWVKAAYWNTATLQMQTHATKAGESLHQGDGVSQTGWNYYDNGYATNPAGSWDVGSGSEELNGTYDMMGNVFEWTEGPYSDTNYGIDSNRPLRSGSYYELSYAYYLTSTGRYSISPALEGADMGFRVASIPEPATMAILVLGGLTVLRRRKRS